MFRKDVECMSITLKEKEKELNSRETELESKRSAYESAAKAGTQKPAK